MTKPKHYADSCVDQIQLPLSFDVARMQEETKALKLRDFVYNDVLPLRAPAHLVDPSFATPTLANNDYAMGSQ
jgi:hypothetical protein